MLKPLILTTILSIISYTFNAQVKNEKILIYQKDTLLFEDDFDKSLTEWKIETDTLRNTKIDIIDEKLIIDVDCGATIWLNKKLSGNLLIEYKRKVLMEDGANDRLSDLNQFWMAHDPENSNLFTRNGTFSQYHNLKLYYFGIGGNSNTTTRCRKYLGNGERYLIEDLREKKYLLEPNKTYVIQTVVYNGVTKVFVDNQEYFSFLDKEPLESGYFGFRTTESRQEIDDLKIYRLK
ncbi:DUF6250 domain-containing protein [Thalassobellus suaedae]|uniref:DUF6250 domain-containing protein n=1 Tax=Thalassobellus suaedae TaxID=3074124 RepID=A0ABY9XXY2_9FLAO|nr:DUF6250 domain-containing protein [Flavobacteriaceae bacterium HL-DH14]